MPLFENIFQARAKQEKEEKLKNLLKLIIEGTGSLPYRPEELNTMDQTGELLTKRKIGNIGQEDISVPIRFDSKDGIYKRKNEQEDPYMTLLNTVTGEQKTTDIKVPKSQQIQRYGGFKPGQTTEEKMPKPKTGGPSEKLSEKDKFLIRRLDNLEKQGDLYRSEGRGVPEEIQKEIKNVATQMGAKIDIVPAVKSKGMLWGENIDVPETFKYTLPERFNKASDQDERKKVRVRIPGVGEDEIYADKLNAAKKKYPELEVIE